MKRIYEKIGIDVLSERAHEQTDILFHRTPQQAAMNKGATTVDHIVMKLLPIFIAHSHLKKT